jgi:hypothetical protein
VRRAIEDLGDTMPEDLGDTMPEDLSTPDRSIQEVERAEQERLAREARGRRQPMLFDAGADESERESDS